MTEGPKLRALVAHATRGVRYATPEDARRAHAAVAEAIRAAMLAPDDGPSEDDCYPAAFAAAVAAHDSKVADMSSPWPTEEYEAGDGPMGYAVTAAVRATLGVVNAPRPAADPTPGPNAFTGAAESFFERALGGSTHFPLVWGAHLASHPLSVREAYEEAKRSLPKAADVIAALVWRLAIAENRSKYAWDVATEATAAAGRD